MDLLGKHAGRMAHAAHLPAFRLVGEDVVAFQSYVGAAVDSLRDLQGVIGEVEVIVGPDVGIELNLDGRECSVLLGAIFHIPGCGITVMGCRENSLLA